MVSGFFGVCILFECQILVKVIMMKLAHVLHPVNSRTWKGEPTGVAWISKEMTCWGYQLSDMTSWFGSDYDVQFLLIPLLISLYYYFADLDLLLRHATPWLDLRCQLIVLTICHKMVSIFFNPLKFLTILLEIYHPCLSSADWLVSLIWGTPLQSKWNMT